MISYHIYSLYVENFTQNMTATITKPQVTLSAKQRMQKFGNLNQRYTEKEADQKMKGIQKIYLLLRITQVLKLYSVRFQSLSISISAIETAKDIINMVMYISFGPVFILFFCFTWKKVDIYTRSESLVLIIFVQ